MKGKYIGKNKIVEYNDGNIVFDNSLKTYIHPSVVEKIATKDKGEDLYTDCVRHFYAKMIVGLASEYGMDRLTFNQVLDGAAILTENLAKESIARKFGVDHIEYIKLKDLLEDTNLN